MSTHDRRRRTEREDVSEGEEEIRISKLAEEEKRKLDEFGPSDPSEALKRYSRLTGDEVQEVLGQKLGEDLEGEGFKTTIERTIERIISRFGKYSSFEELRTKDAEMRDIVESYPGFEKIRNEWIQFEAQSSVATNEGIEKVKEMTDKLPAELIGAIDKRHYQYGSAYTKIKRSKEVGSDDVYRALAMGFEPISARDLVEILNRGTVDGHQQYSLNGNIIAGNDWGQEWDNSKIFGQPVLPKDYYHFVDVVRAMLEEKFKGQKSLPEGTEEKIDKARREYKMKSALDAAKTIGAGSVSLKHAYGMSYFGSGGGWGGVHAYNLTEFREGKVVEKQLNVEVMGDDGFSMGPSVVSIEPDTLLIAHGGDSIGYNGREWREIFLCESVEKSSNL